MYIFVYNKYCVLNSVNADSNSIALIITYIKYKHKTPGITAGLSLSPRPPAHPHPH